MGLISIGIFMICILMSALHMISESLSFCIYSMFLCGITTFVLFAINQIDRHEGDEDFLDEEFYDDNL